MERELLRFFLTSGPVLKYDVAHFTRRMRRASGGEGTPLFHNERLNNGILFKQVDHHEQQNEDSFPLKTVVFFPYDSEKPYEGGESFIVSEAEFNRFFNPRSEKDPARISANAEDFGRLLILDGAPAFCPYIVAIAFDRAQRTIPAEYLDITPDVRAKLTSHLKSRIRPLVAAAYRDSRCERAVDELTDKLFMVRDVSDIWPLIEALKLPPEQALELVQSWIGIAYFEHEYAQMQAQMRRFIEWLNKYPMPRENLGFNERTYVQSLNGLLKEKVKKRWNDAIAISTRYRSTYEDLVFNGKPEGFRSFLCDAKKNYWSMAEILCRLEQTIIAWSQFTRNYQDSALPYALLIEFYGVLRFLHVQAGADIAA